MNKKKFSGFPLGLGIPSLLCIFVVLMMCILSLLTYMKAENFKKTVEREIEYSSAYYQADAEAKYRLNENDDDQQFAVSMNDGRVLKVIRKNGIIEEYSVTEEDQ